MSCMSCIEKKGIYKTLQRTFYTFSIYVISCETDEMSSESWYRRHNLSENEVKHEAGINSARTNCSEHVANHNKKEAEEVYVKC